MSDLDVAGTRLLLTLVAVAGGVVTLAVALHLTARRGDGVFRYFPFAVLLSVGALVVSSGRILVVSDATRGELLAQGRPVSSWTHVCSAFLVLASLERIASYALRRNRSSVAPHALLLLAFVMFWCTTVASPALLGAEGSFAHEYLYTLLLGCAALLVSQREGDAAVAGARNGLIVFLALSVVLIPLRPALAIDPTYRGGFFPGLPRFAGLSPHSVSLGMLAELELLCLYARPLPQRWLNRVCWTLGLGALFLAQSKISWVSFPICAAFIFWMRDARAPWSKFRDPRRRSFSLVIPLALLGVTVGLGLVYILSNGGLTSDWFLVGDRAADLSSLTGRDQIWAVALKEWARHPVFGYGTDLFDAPYRISIRMFYAVNSHNQFIDTLARSGLVGAAGLGFYLVVLLVFSVKHARSSHGLSLALFVGIVLRSVSEVPLGLFGYGPEVLPHFLLLAILPGIPRTRSAAAEPAPQQDISRPAQELRSLAS